MEQRTGLGKINRENHFRNTSRGKEPRMDANGLTNREWTRIWVVGAFGYDRERFFIRVYSRPFAVSQSIRVHLRLVGGPFASTRG
jgi:hypothetical protein